MEGHYFSNYTKGKKQAETGGREGGGIRLYIWRVSKCLASLSLISNEQSLKHLKDLGGGGGVKNDPSQVFSR